MDQNTNLTDELLAAESLIAQGQTSLAADALARLAADAEEYVDRNCPTTEELQWFSFPSIFERLAYRRVEQDPRELRDVGEPLDRLYTDLGHALICEGEYDDAIEALKRAVRWNPMGCGARLDLAELFRAGGNVQEYLGLTYSVFERASEARHVARAFANFARHFHETGDDRTAAAALRCGRRMETDDATLKVLLDQAAGTAWDPESLTDEQATEALGEQGLPDAANAEVAICLLMCASDAARDGNRNLATALTLRARDLVGLPACQALMQLIQDTDAAGAGTEGGEADGEGR